MREVKQSVAANVMLLMVDSANHNAGKTGLTLTVTLSKDGGAFASITPTVTERGNGWYNIALTATDTNTLGDLIVRATSTGADDGERISVVVSNIAQDIYAEISNPSGAVASDAGNTSGTFKTNLTQAANNYWKDAFLKFTSGSLINQVKKITGYDGTTKFVTVDAFTAAPAASDTFELINQ